MEVTVLLKEASEGNSGALDKLAEALYPELKAMARRRSPRVGPRPAVGSCTHAPVHARGTTSRTNRRNSFFVSTWV